MFQTSIYKLFNNDLKNLNNNQLQIHWKTIGKKENRISNVSHFFDKYPDFKLNLYKEKYPDLKNYDDIIIMSHYHHNDSKDIILPKKIINNFNNYIDEYLKKYYIYKFNYIIIVLDYYDDINFNNLNFDNDIHIFTNKNYNINNNKCIIHKVDFDIYIIQDLILNFNSDYFLFLKDIHIELNNLIIHNPNIIFHEKYIYIKKNILKFYNFYTLLNTNIHTLKINNKILINNNINYINYKFHHINNLICNNELKHEKNIFIDIGIDNYNDLFYIIKIISYLENKKFNIYLKENNYLFFKNYFIYDNNLDLKIINNFNELDNHDNFIITKKIDFNIQCFSNIDKINNIMINEIFKNLLFLDLKKDIIIINIDNHITENFILNSLINIDFQNSILIISNFKKIQFDFLNHFTHLTLEEIYENIYKKINISYLDLELVIGLFADYYIGPNNHISYIWNYLSPNLILYINNFNSNYFNTENLIINNNILKIDNFNHKIISYNFNLFKVYNENLKKINNKYDFYIDYYFNDYILQLYFTKDSFTFTEKENNNILNKHVSIFKFQNDFYIKYFNQYQKIYNHYFINFYNNNYSPISSINLNRTKIINKIVFIIQIFNIEYINYYVEFFLKYYYDKNYIVEFYLKSNNNKVQLKNEKYKINYLNNNNFIVILEDIYSKYNYNDLIFIIKANNLNIININNEIYNFIFHNSLYINHIDYLIFNLKIFEKSESSKIIDILKLNRIINKSNDIDQNILYYMNTHYLNDLDFNKLIYNKSLLTKFLIYSEQIEHNFYNYNNIINFIQQNNNIIEYFYYNIKTETLKIILIDNKIDDDISDITNEYSLDEKEDNYEFKINIYNLNLVINKLSTNYSFVFDIFEHKLNLDNIELNYSQDTIIYNKYNELSILILNSHNIIKFGFLNDYYFKDNSLLNLNIFLFNKINKFKFYLLDEELEETKFNINSKIQNYFQYLNFDTILQIRKFNNLNYIYNYENIIDIYVINLKDRFDKKKYMIDQLNKLNIIKYKFFNAYTINKDELNKYEFIKSEHFLNNLNINYVTSASGCKISHYELLKNLPSNNKFTLILEDDVVLESNFLNYIFVSLNQLENKYFDLLYLGCNLNNKNDNKLISNNILSVKNPKTTTAYLVKNLNKNKILNTIQNSNNEIDEVYSNSELIKFCIYPMIAYQKNLKSDIVSTNDYGYYHDKYYY